jgi:uncharacterized lipoprotein YbaY
LLLLSLFSCKEAKIEEKPKDDVIPVKIMTLEKKDQAQTYRLSSTVYHRRRISAFL